MMRGEVYPPLRVRQFPRIHVYEFITCPGMVGAIDDDSRNTRTGPFVVTQLIRLGYQKYRPRSNDYAQRVQRTIELVTIETII